MAVKTKQKYSRPVRVAASVEWVVDHLFCYGPSGRFGVTWQPATFFLSFFLFTWIDGRLPGALVPTSLSAASSFLFIYFFISLSRFFFSSFHSPQRHLLFAHRFKACFRELFLLSTWNVMNKEKLNETDDKFSRLISQIFMCYSRHLLIVTHAYYSSFFGGHCEIIKFQKNLREPELRFIRCFDVFLIYSFGYLYWIFCLHCTL